jgi:hypothetical protein
MSLRVVTATAGSLNDVENRDWKEPLCCYGDKNGCAEDLFIVRGTQWGKAWHPRDFSLFSVNSFTKRPLSATFSSHFLLTFKVAKRNPESELFT